MVFREIYDCFVAPGDPHRKRDSVGETKGNAAPLIRPRFHLLLVVSPSTALTKKNGEHACVDQGKRPPIAYTDKLEPCRRLRAASVVSLERLLLRSSGNLICPRCIEFPARFFSRSRVSRGGWDERRLAGKKFFSGMGYRDAASTRGGATKPTSEYCRAAPTSTAKIISGGWRVGQALNRNRD